MPDDVWTPKTVGSELVEALRYAERAAGRVGPARLRSSMPTLQMTADERELEAWLAVQEHEPEPMRRGYDPRRVSQLERVLEWPARYLDMARIDPSGYAMFKGWVHSRLRKRLKFDALCEAMCWPRRSAYRARDRVLSEIAVGLTVSGIARGRH